MAAIDSYDRTLYRHRHKIENMFGRLKDWRRIHTRYDRCAHTFKRRVGSVSCSLHIRHGANRL